jgi:hypothetical protein
MLEERKDSEGEEESYILVYSPILRRLTSNPLESWDGGSTISNQHAEPTIPTCFLNLGTE